jgi:hypothetical protein
MDIAAIKRQKRLRRQILSLVEADRATPWTKGQMVKDILEAQPDGIESDEELVRLAQDLVNCQLLEVADSRTLRSQGRALKFLQYRVTAKGTALLAGAVPVEPLVEDERI